VILVLIAQLLAMVFEWVIHSQLYHHIFPFIPCSQFSFIKGTGAQDCGTAITLAATQVLEDREECRIIYVGHLIVHGGVAC